MDTAKELIQASVHETERLLFFTLLQLAVIVVCGRLAGAIAVRCRQSRAVGEILIGILLGPSLFGLLFPDLFQFVFRSAPPEPLTIISQVGLILLLFQIGLEFDFSHLKSTHNRQAITRVAALGLIFPFALGLAFGHFSAPYLAPKINALGYSLFVATAFSITALPVLGRIMIELGMQRTAIGVIAISAAAINDVIGWLLLAVVSALTVAEFSPGDFAWKILWLAVYVAVCWWLLRPLLQRLIGWSQARSEALSPNMLGVLLGLVFVSGMTTYKLGIFAIFGGFMLGVLLYDQHKLVAAWREKVGHFVTVFFVPVFFTYTGLRTDISSLGDAQLWGWCLLLLALATLGKFGGCYWAARWAGLDSRRAKAIGIMMNTRALMELVVINIGYDLGVIPVSVFTMLVLMALFSTVVTTPALRYWLPELRSGRWENEAVPATASAAQARS